jgi:hypothetical protein
VADRLRRFFAEWTAQLAAGTAEIWARVERRLAHKPPEVAPDGDAAPPPGIRHTPMQQQPVQQQQQKTAEDEK